MINHEMDGQDQESYGYQPDYHNTGY